MTFVATSGLGKDYGALTAVRALDLEIGAGEVFGLLGPNGAGKTTAISMLCGVLTPTRGTASIGGADIRRDAFAARRKTGLAPQELALYEDLTARENLAYFGGLYGLRGRDLADASAWALGVAGLLERAAEPVRRFSGGMKRRLNLAAGILHRPPLLVCDEPTVGVDPQSRAHIFETLRGLNRDHGTTILYTSHYMEEVQALCPRVGVMDQGRLAALDTVENLLRIHGQAEAELVIETDARADAVEAALAGFGPVRREGARFRFGAPPSFAGVASAVEAAGARVLSLQVARSDLETVFLRLTGHQLRDAS